MSDPYEEWPNNDTALIILLGVLASIMVLLAAALR